MNNKDNNSLNSKINFRRGSVELMVLYLLSQNDNYYGWELTQLIADLTNGSIQIPLGSFYRLLYKLIDAGYITEEKRLVGKRRERVYYHIEDSGRERLKNLMDDYNATITAMQSVLSYHPQSE